MSGAASLATFSLLLHPAIALTVPDTRALLFTSGVVLVLVGLYLRWRLGDHFMETEERVKDGHLTEAQARRRMMLFRVSGPAVVLLGVVAFAFVFSRT